MKNSLTVKLSEMVSMFCFLNRSGEYWSNLVHFPAPSQKNTKKIILKNILIFSEKKFHIFQDGCWPTVKLFIPPNIPGRMLTKPKNKKFILFLILWDDCWFSLSSGIPNPEPKRKQKKISYGRRMLTKRKVSCTPYTPGCIYVYINTWKKFIKK